MTKHFSKLPFQLGAMVALVLLALAVRSIAQAYEIDHDYRIEFTSDNPSGSFSGLKGDVNFDPNDLVSSSFNVTVDASTISTGNALKNSHAKGKGYFDVDNFPEIAFKSNEITATTAGFEASGMLNMKGISKPLVIPFTFAENEAGIKAFEGEFDIDRLDFGIGGNANKPSKILHISLYVPVK